MQSSTSAGTTNSCGLSLWAGLLVGGTSLATGFLMSAGVWFAPEFVIAVVAVLQLAALTGAGLGCASLLRRAALGISGLERTVAGVAAATSVLTLGFLLVLASIFVMEAGMELGVYVLAGFVGGAWVHGAWLMGATCALWWPRAPIISRSPA